MRYAPGKREEPVNDEPTASCRNCGAPLHGEFCARCGQHEGSGDLHFAEAVSGLVGHVVTWDSRFWRTLQPLLLRPGYLTAEFIAGRRVRYMPPFRLYLVISFVLFFTLSLSGRDLVVSSIAPAGEEGAGFRVLRIGAKGEGDEQRVAEALARAGAAEAGNGAALADRIRVELGGKEGAPWLRALEVRMEENVRAVLEDPGDYIAFLLDRLPQAMFVMLPVFALLLRLAYLAFPFHYLQHLVFGLHYHSFICLFYLLMLGLGRLSLPGLGWLWLALPGYLPFALRRAYGSSLGGALGKALFLYLAYGILLLIVFALAAVGALAFM